MWVCTSIAFPVDISYDAFNVDFKTIAQNGNGYFIQVKPGMHKDGSALPDAVNIIENHAKGVMNVVGKPAGIYEYIFVSTDNGFCGMANGEQSVVRVYLVPQLTGFPVLTNICPGSTEEINFNHFVPPEIRYFIDEMGWSITYIFNGKEIEMPIKASLSNVGDNLYRYTVNDKSGKFTGKYSAMQSSVYYCPEDSVHLTHTIRIREDEEYAIPSKTIAFCTDVLGLVSETRDMLGTNLFGYLGSSVPDGKWSIKYMEDLNPSDCPINETSGHVTIPIALLTALEIDTIIFQYSYRDCMANDTFSLLTFTFNKSTFANTFSEQEREVCRNLMSGVVELSSIFGFTVPLTSGIWFQKIGDAYEEMLYGAVDISEMKSGSLYTFRYDVNSAVDAICLIQGSSSLFHIRLHDLEVANAEAKICKKQFADGITIDLSRYVPGLNDISAISPGKVTWKDFAGAEIENPSNYTLKLNEGKEEEQPADTIYKMHYQYEVQSTCGLYTGNLYITAVDSIDVSQDTLREIKFCYTDDYAKHIDLFQILGIIGAKGTFILCEDVVNEKGETINVPANITNEIEKTGIMNAFELYNTANEFEEYTFCYNPGQNEGNTCISSDKIQIKIIITKIVEQKLWDKSESE
jgi:hypothetical protein